MFRTKAMTGFTLYPDKAYLEIKVKLYNRTPFSQTFLWWANPAVHVNEHYQSVFPPDVNAVFDHGKRDVSRFPIATGTYYKVDYSSGIDISRYKNIPMPTSYMAIASKYDFVGGFEHDTQGGLLHVANHYISPGKKQWTWGCGDFGKAWDRNLTDSDGPYIELMCGVYTDNQPDFSWLMPYEERCFNQYFMPYRDLGMVKNATKDALINLEFSENSAIVKAYCTGIFPSSKIILSYKEKILLDDTFDFTPEISYFKEISLKHEFKEHNFKIELFSCEGKLLVSWKPEKEEIKPIPQPARPADEPKNISSTEQLYLTGLHLEQYRHATFSPSDYYLEALKREPTDVRCNNAMGLLLLKKGLFEEAEKFFINAINTLTQRNPNPYDGEPFYNLGICLQFQHKYDAAYEAFYKATWNYAWQSSSYFHLAQIDCIRHNWQNALELIERSLITNSHHHKALHIKTIVLRKLSQYDEAMKIIDEALLLDYFNFGIWFEKYFISQNKKILEFINELMHGYLHNYIEISLDYAIAGLYDEALFILDYYHSGNEKYPMIYYLQAWYYSLLKETDKAKEYIILAEQTKPDYCFPNRIEELLSLNNALNIMPGSAKALYYAGNFWYHNRQYNKAVECWEKSIKSDNKFSTVHRNLALAYFNKYDKKQAALIELEKAMEIDPKDARILMELDQLYKRLNKPLDVRIALLEKYPESVDYRDDLYLELATLYNIKGKNEEALKMIMNRRFHPWEGGEGKVAAQYILANIEMAKKAIKIKNFALALKYLSDCESYPENLGEGKLYGAFENDIWYWKGCSYEGLNDIEKANFCWKKGTEGNIEPSMAIYYNDQQPDKLFYQGLCLNKLGHSDTARSKFNKLIDFGEKHLFDIYKIDYFAVSLPDLLIWEDDLQMRNKIHCYYLIGLGYLGLEKLNKAKEFLNIVYQHDSYHIGSIIHLNLISYFRN